MIIIFKYSTTNTRIEQLFRSRVQLATKQQLLYVIEAIKCYPQVDCQKKPNCSLILNLSINISIKILFVSGAPPEIHCIVSTPSDQNFKI